MTGNRGTPVVPLASSLPRGSGRSSSRCPARTRDERPSGVGASAPAGRRSPPRPAALTSASGTVVPASQAVQHPLLWGREKRLSVVDSVHCAGKTRLGMGKCSPLAGVWAATSPASLARQGAVISLWRHIRGTSGRRDGLRVVSSIHPRKPDRGNAPRWPEHGPRQAPPAQRPGRGHLPFGTYPGDRRAKGRLACRVVYPSSSIKRAGGRGGAGVPTQSFSLSRYRGTGGRRDGLRAVSSVHPPQ